MRFWHQLCKPPVWNSGSFLRALFRGSLAPSPNLSRGITRMMPWWNFSSGEGLLGVLRTDILLFSSNVKTQHMYKTRDKLKPANFGMNDFIVSQLRITNSMQKLRQIHQPRKMNENCTVKAISQPKRVYIGATHQYTKWKSQRDFDPPRATAVSSKQT